MRKYATTEQLAAYPGGDSIPEAWAPRLLRAASRAVDYLLTGVRYAVDGDGMPTDPDVAEVLADSVCAIAVEAQAAGMLEAGATQQWASASIGAVSLSQRQQAEGTQVVAGMPVPAMVLLDLQGIGQVSVSTGGGTSSPAPTGTAVSTATLSAAKAYTDEQVALVEAPAANPYDDAPIYAALADEATARATGDTETLDAARAYTDTQVAGIILPAPYDDTAVRGLITTETTARESADTDLQAAIAGKADTADLATKADQSALAAEVAARTDADATLQDGLDGKAPVVHTHTITDVDGLQAALDDAAASGGGGGGPTVTTFGTADASVPNLSGWKTFTPLLSCPLPADVKPGDLVRFSVVFKLSASTSGVLSMRVGTADLGGMALALQANKWMQFEGEMLVRSMTSQTARATGSQLFADQTGNSNESTFTIAGAASTADLSVGGLALEFGAAVESGTLGEFTFTVRHKAAYRIPA